MHSRGYQILETSGLPIVGGNDVRWTTGAWINDPVVVGTGEQVFHSRDLVWPHDGTFISADRLYRHQTANQGGVTTDFGRFVHSNLRIVVDESQNELTATVNIGDGDDLTFTRPSTAGAYSIEDVRKRYTLDEVDGTQYKLTFRNGYEYYFEPNTDPTNMVSTRNRYGEGEDYYYDGSDYLTKITVSAGSDIHVDRDTDHTITKIRDYAGRTVNYSYDAYSNLTKVEDACGSCSTIPAAEYGYDGSHRITLIKDAYGTTVREIAYGAYGRPLIRESAGRGDMDNDADIETSRDAPDRFRRFRALDLV